MHPSVTPLAAQLRLQTQLLLNCLEGLDPAQAARRVTPTTNNVAFLTTHLLESRHFLAETLGAPRPSPLPPAIANARSLDTAGPLPALEQLRAWWEAVSAHLAVAIERLDTAQLAAPGPPLPGADGTRLGAAAFLVHHEAYHLGQLALLRRQLGGPPMSYALPAREGGRMGA